MSSTDGHRTPGQLIEALLSERGWNQEVLALVLGTTIATISHLVTGRRRMDAGTALALGDVFGVDPDRFLDLQKSYDLRKAMLETAPDPGRATRAALFASLPISEMTSRGWISPNTRDFSDVEGALCRFFDVRSLDEVPDLRYATKKTDSESPITPIQRAWIRRVVQIASEQVTTARYTPAATRNAVENLSSLLLSAEEARKVPRILSECGIRFVIVEPLKSGKIDGVCLWLDDKSPVIALSMRFDRIDNFWFVLRHEIEHVLRGHGKKSPVIDSELDVTCSISQEEREANEAAADFCVPQQRMDQLIARKGSMVSKLDLLGFANTIRVHPGIVAGQVQRRTGRFNTFREHQVKIRSIVSPGAAVDGWGDIYHVGE